NATADQRRQVHQRLAADAPEVEEQARHRALACSGPDEAVAELLEQAAASARHRGAPDVAAELAERAGALTPPGAARRLHDRRLLAADYHFHAGALEHAKAAFAALIGTGASASDTARTLLLLGEVSYRLGEVDDAIGYLRRAVDAADGDVEVTIRAELAY